MCISNRLFCYLCALLLFSGTCYGEKVRITTGEWVPYLSQYTPHYGPLNRIVTEAFALEGINVEYGFFPWKRALLSTLYSEWDGSSMWGSHQERRDSFFHSNVIAKQQYMFFHLISFPFDWNSQDDLQGLVIGANLGYNYHTEFETAEKAGEIIVYRVKTEKQVIHMLLNSHVQIGLMEQAVAYYVMSTMNPEETAKITFHNKPQSSDGLHLLLTKTKPKNKALMKRFNRGLQRLIESGKVNTYIQDAHKGGYPVLETPWTPD